MPLGADLFLDTTPSLEEVKAHLLSTMPFEDEPDFEGQKCLHGQITTRPPHWNRLETYPDPFHIDYKLSVLLWCLHKTDPDRQELYYTSRR